MSNISNVVTYNHWLDTSTEAEIREVIPKHTHTHTLSVPWKGLKSVWIKDYVKVKSTTKYECRREKTK